MRQVTKSVVGVLSLGVLATSWALGQASDTNDFTANYAGVGNASASPSPSASTPASPAPGLPSASASPTQAPTGSPTASATPTKAPTPAPTQTKAPTPEPTQTKVPSPTTVTKISAAESYRYGVIQLEVTKSGGAITGIALVQAGATGGRQAAFDPLVNAAIQAQGSNFGNLSQATYTTQAFKAALESALAKF